MTQHIEKLLTEVTTEELANAKNIQHFTKDDKAVVAFDLADDAGETSTVVVAATPTSMVIVSEPAIVAPIEEVVGEQAEVIAAQPEPITEETVAAVATEGA